MQTRVELPSSGLFHVVPSHVSRSEREALSFLCAITDTSGSVIDWVCRERPGDKQGFVLYDPDDCLFSFDFHKPTTNKYTIIAFNPGRLNDVEKIEIAILDMDKNEIKRFMWPANFGYTTMYLMQIYQREKVWKCRTLESADFSKDITSVLISVKRV